MPVTKINADRWDFEVDVNGTPTPIKGIEDFEIGSSKTDADTSDFDSEGVEEHLVIRRGKSLTLNGHWLEDEADGSRDPGQEAVAGLADLVGPEALGTFRFTSPGGTVFQFQASVEESVSGDKNDVTKFSYTLTRSGATVSPSS